VMARIEHEETTLGQSGEVVQLRPQPASRPAGRATVVVVGLALAAAAAAVLWVRSASPPPDPAPLPVASVHAPKPEVPAPPPPAVETAEEEPSPAASIEAVDFGNSAGSIFMVPAGDETTPVVWLVDDPASARMEPL